MQDKEEKFWDDAYSKLAGEKKSLKQKYEDLEEELKEKYEEVSPPQSRNRPEDIPFQYVNLPLSGKLITSTDGTQLGEGDFQTLKNMRYGERGPKTVTGMTKINTSIFYSG